MNELGGGLDASTMPPARPLVIFYWLPQTKDVSRKFDVTAKTFRAVGRHFVTLSCIQSPKPGASEKPVLISGFVVETRNIWLYVTAGHVIKDIRTAMAAGGTLGTWRLGDQTAGKSKQFKDSGIPFDFDIDRWIEIENEANGLDYAAVVLHPLYVRQLEVGGIIPIRRGSWGDHVTEYDRWVLVGVPSETLEHDGGSKLKAKTVFVPLEPADAPVGAGDKAKNQFYARLKDDSPSVVQDIGGMSGGPIFAIKRTSKTELKYAVIGVQSAWYPRARIIAACPFSSFGNALNDVIDKAIEQVGQDRTRNS